MAAVITEIVPLATDDYGVIRVGETRIPLETVVTSFEQGASAEQIVYQFPVLKLADVYAVIAYLLNHPPQIRDYMQKVEAEEFVAQRNIHAQFDQSGIRHRLMARQTRS